MSATAQAGALRIGVVALTGLAGALFVPSSAIAMPRVEELSFQHGTAATNADLRLDLRALFAEASLSSTARSTPTASTAKVETSEELRLMQKLAELRAIANGELGPGSVAVSDDVLDDLASLAALAPHTSAVATFGGAVALEWRSDGVEYTAELQPGHRLFLCADNTVTDDLRETEVDFDAHVLRAFLATGDWAE